MHEFSRRTALLSATAATAFLRAKKSAAQSEPFAPKINQTFELATTAQGVQFMIDHFQFMTASTRLLYYAREQISIDDVAVLPLVNEELFSPLIRLRDEAEREDLSKRVQSEAFVDSIQRADINVVPVVDRIASAHSDFGLSPEGPTVRRGLESVYHVERIAAVQELQDGEQPYICRYFPFSYFC